MYAKHRVNEPAVFPGMRLLIQVLQRTGLFEHVIVDRHGIEIPVERNRIPDLIAVSGHIPHLRAEFVLRLLIPQLRQIRHKAFRAPPCHDVFRRSQYHVRPGIVVQCRVNDIRTVLSVFAAGIQNTDIDLHRRIRSFISVHDLLHLLLIGESARRTDPPGDCKLLHFCFRCFLCL